MVVVSPVRGGAWPRASAINGERARRRRRTGGGAAASDDAPCPTPPPTVAVVGAGVGGLVAAGLLASVGAEVTVLERRSAVGGRLASSSSGADIWDGARAGTRSGAPTAPPEASFRFDTGPSLVLFPRLYREAFAALIDGASGGARGKEGTLSPVPREATDAELESAGVSLVRVAGPCYRVWFGAGRGGDGIPTGPAQPLRAGSKEATPPSWIDLDPDEMAMAKTADALSPGDGRAYSRWLAAARAMLVHGSAAFVERDPDVLDGVVGAGAGGGGGGCDGGAVGLLASPTAFAAARGLALGGVGPSALLGGHGAGMSKRFSDPRLVAALTFQDLYVGLTPASAPGVFSLLAATEARGGGGRGGEQRLTLRLQPLSLPMPGKTDRTLPPLLPPS